MAEILAEALQQRLAGCPVPGCGRPSREGADKRSIDGELDAVAEREAVADDFDVPRVMNGHIEVDSRQSKVTINTGSGFLARLCDGPLDVDGNCSGGKYAGTGSAVVAVRIQCSSAGPGTWAKRGSPKPPEEQDPKVGRGDGYIFRGA